MKYFFPLVVIAILSLIVLTNSSFASMPNNYTNLATTNSTNTIILNPNQPLNLNNATVITPFKGEQFKFFSGNIIIQDLYTLYFNPTAENPIPHATTYLIINDTYNKTINLNKLFFKENVNIPKEVTVKETTSKFTLKKGLNTFIISGYQNTSDLYNYTFAFNNLKYAIEIDPIWNFSHHSYAYNPDNPYNGTPVNNCSGNVQNRGLFSDTQLYWNGNSSTLEILSNEQTGNITYTLPHPHYLQLTFKGYEGSNGTTVTNETNETINQTILESHIVSTGIPETGNLSTCLQLPLIHIQAERFPVHVGRQRRIRVASQAVCIFKLLRAMRHLRPDKQGKGYRISKDSCNIFHAYEEMPGREIYQ